MSDAHSISLTPKDFEVLEGLLSSPHAGLADASILIRRKLHAATLVFAQDIGPDVVTVNSRVRYRINGGNAEERTLVADTSEGIQDLIVLLGSAHGIALIGARVGQTLQIARLDGSHETLSVEAILYQPEAQLGRGPTTASITNMAEPEAPSAVNLSAYRLRRASATLSYGEDDDPGPSAA